jgi:DnaK suppressor protein
MKYFTIEQRETLERTLKTRESSLRTEILGALHQAEEQGLSVPNYYTKVDDASLADLQQSLDFAEIERDALELRQVKDALRRLHSPDYGLCIDCGAEIPFARLSVQPAAVRCTHCQQEYEVAHG